MATLPIKTTTHRAFFEVADDPKSPIRRSPRQDLLERYGPAPKDFNLPKLVELNPRAGSRNVEARPPLPPKMRMTGVNLEEREPEVVGLPPSPTRPDTDQMSQASFQTPAFKSSTVLRTVNINQRHQDMYTGKEYTVSRKKAMIFHTSRYSLLDENASRLGSPNDAGDLRLAGTPAMLPRRPVHASSQRQRMQQQVHYMDKMRTVKRKLDMMHHKEHRDLVLGGTQLEVNQRISINNELRKLKAMVMPDQALWLYHGKGIRLPGEHLSLKPKARMPMEAVEEIIAATDPVRNEAETLKKQKKKKALPPIKPKNKSSAARKGKNLGRISNPPRTNSVQSVHVPVNSPVPSLQGLSIRAHTAPRELDTDPNLPPTPTTLANTDISAPPAEQEGSRTDTQSRAETLASTRIGTEAIPTPGPSVMTSEPPPPRPPETPHPLQEEDEHEGGNPLGLVTEQEADELRQAFRRLDTDHDGHVQFHQLSKSLPRDLTQQQQKYIKQVYDIVNATTFFGIDEFITISYMSKRIAHLSREALAAYSQIQFKRVRDDIMTYVEGFQQIDTEREGKIDYPSLRTILSAVYQTELAEDSDTWLEITSVVSQNAFPDHIKKMDFLALLPYFVSKQPQET